MPSILPLIVILNVVMLCVVAVKCRDFFNVMLGVIMLNVAARDKHFRMFMKQLEPKNIQQKNVSPVTNSINNIRP